MKAQLMALVLSASAGVAFAVTSYVVPWEVNPTLTARIGIVDASDNAVTAFVPGSFDLPADGEWLAFTAASDSTGTRNVMALRMSTLTPLSGGGLVTADIAGSSSTLWGGGGIFADCACNG